MNNLELTSLIEQTNSTYKRYWLNQLQRLEKQPARLAKLVQSIEYELANLQLRQNLLAKTAINYPAELPVSQDVNNIKQVISANQVTIICGETGSGKTTQLPKVLLELGYGVNGLIGHTQPRRIAARSLATRIAAELGCQNHENNLVGYKMRFHDRTSHSTMLKLMTDGILLQEIQNDKLLLQYSALIIDEVHERSLNIDFILGYLQQLVKRRPDLKIIITSATIENEKLQRFFAGAPLVNVSGKTYPVDIIYQPYSEEDDDVNLNQAIYQAIDAALSVERGNGLVFLPGEREIKNCLNYLRKTDLKHCTLLPLYSRQNNEEQARIFSNDGGLKIILATNIAETSLTIPGIKFVIDSGIARVKRYSLRNRVEQLQVESISQASSRQRAGRAGRVSHGLCVRLFSEQEFNLRPQFTEPELLRSNLANVILRLLSLNLGDPASFPFLDQPENKAFNDGFRTLYQVGAIGEENEITPLGRKLAQLPVDVQLARVLIAAAEQFACLSEALVIVAFLAIQDPREFPLEQQQLSRERHAIWADKQSEFMQILNLWRWYHEQLTHKKSNKKLLEVCHKQFVSLLRLREWHELHRQLKESLAALGYRENSTPASYANLHTALLAGFVVNIGQRDIVENYYLSTNGRKFLIHPSAIVDGAKWMVTANLVETSRLYARNSAVIEPQWLNQVAGHLYKYTYSHEHWDKKRGEVVATKSALLYGLQISQTKVSLGTLNPELAREVFIREALAANQLLKNYAFLQHNQQVIRELEKLEDKLRTSLTIMDDELYTFYNAQLPADVFDVPSLEQFLIQNEAKLKINLAAMIERLNSSTTTVNLFPDSIINQQQEIRLKYVFDHSSAEDGVIAIIDLAKLTLLDENLFQWLVPGLIRDKVTYLIKALPKSQRLQFNPQQESISEFLEFADSEQNFLQQFIIYSEQYKKIKLSYPDLLKIEFPVPLRCHFRIVDNKKVIASGDDLAALKLKLTPRLNEIVVKHSSKHQISNISGYIPELQQLLQEVKLGTSKQELTGYNSLIVEKDGGISFGVVSELAKARTSSYRGLVQLIKLQLKEQQKYLLGKKLAGFAEISMALINVYTKDELTLSCSNYVLNMAISEVMAEAAALSADEFQAMVVAIRAQVSPCLQDFSSCLVSLAKLYQEIKLKLAKHPLAESINLQLDDLIYPEFLSFTRFVNLQNYPRYLQAILLRMSKYSQTYQRDRVLEDEVNQIYDKWYNYVDELESRNKIVTRELYDFRYKIEELRVSFFAQELKTLYPVSSKRLLNELEQLYLQNLT